VHYTRGGLWVDYDLMSTLPGLFVLGEANFSDHGANRLGASALMQGLADGYFVIPYTVGDYLLNAGLKPVKGTEDAFSAAKADVQALIDRVMAVKGTRSVDSLHRELGLLLWNHCGMGRNRAGLTEAIGKVRDLGQRFWSEVRVTGESGDLNQELEKACRLVDFFGLGELMCRDALEREESCGGHFREEHQTPDGEAQRDDEKFCHAAVWEWTGDDSPAVRHAEPLIFERIPLAQRSYK